MKIALVAQHTTPLAHDGTPREAERARLQELTRSLAAGGHEVTLYAQKTDQALPDKADLCDGVRVEHIGAGDQKADERDLLARVPTFSGSLRDRLTSQRPDVLHAVRWTSGLAALAASRGLDIPVIQSFQSLGVAERRFRLLPATAGTERMRLEPAIGRSVTAVLAGSTDEESDLARLGVPRRHIKVVPDGVDVAEFDPDGAVAARSGRPRLVTIADMEKGAGLELLLRALTKVPGAELVIAAGPTRDELRARRERERLAALAEALGVGDRVTFSGQVARADLPPLLRSADLYVTTGEYEPSATLPLQAMACGTPVVAAGLGGQVDAVIDGTTGILVPPGHPALMGQRIRQLLAHPMMLEAYSVAAADRARSRFSWDRIAQETLAVYDKALGATAVKAA
ncbi:MAG TPA: glycosyltransferase [Trebonia sp.]|jgi:glycosyltransferase involved in cell wall biosynthesis|nr:glycosyltransferase [Trebonia sp.]